MTPQPTRALSSAALKVAETMSAHREPATAKVIAALAGIAYSTTTPALRELRNHRRAEITDPAAKPSLWQLTGTDPQVPVSTDPATASPKAPTPEQLTPPKETPPGPHDTDQADRADGTANQADRADQTGGTADQADRTADQDSDRADRTADGPDQDDKPRTHRSPEKPRRPKGALRGAVLGVIVAEPDRAFKVSEICKVLDAANTDGTHNKAGAGAVANALDKLAHDGSVHRIEGSPAAYQAV